MSIIELTELGSNAIIGGLLIYILTKQMPKQVNDFTSQLGRFTSAVNRLTMVMLSSIDAPPTEKLRIHDEVMKQLNDENGNGK